MLTFCIKILLFDLRYLHGLGIRPILYNPKAKRFLNRTEWKSRSLIVLSMFSIIFAISLNGIHKISTRQADVVQSALIIIFAGSFCLGFTAVGHFLLDSGHCVDIFNMLVLFDVRNFKREGKLNMTNFCGNLYNFKGIIKKYVTYTVDGRERPVAGNLHLFTFFRIFIQ